MANTIPQKSRNLNRANQFGTGAKDPNHGELGGWQNYSIFQDSGGGNQSPISVSSSADTTIAVPGGATVMRIYASTALRISDAAAGADGYFVIPASTIVDWPCASPQGDPNSGTTGQLFLRGDASTSAVQFSFLCI